MISMYNVAVTASFMTTGMCSVNRSEKPPGEDIYAKWEQGAFELHFEMCQYAEVSEKIAEYATDTLNLDFPGVYDYEVSEPFGIWFAEQVFAEGCAPTTVAAKQKLARLAAEFFIQPKNDFEAGVLFMKLTEHIK